MPLPAFRLLTFFLVLAPTILVLVLSVPRLRTPVQRMFFFFGISALCWYSGVGAAYETVTDTYLWAYLAFLVAMAGSFLLTLACTQGLAEQVQWKTGPGVTALVNHRLFVRWTITIYLLISAVPLVYPTFQLHRLLVPPRPDLVSAFYDRFSDVEEPALNRVLEYIALLSSPFYLLALYHWRRKFVPLAIGIFLPLYFQYCAKAYIGRGAIATALGIWFLSLWHAHPRARKYLVSGAIVTFPFVCVAMYEYKSLRLGGAAMGVDWLEATEMLARSETSFPLDSTLVIQSEARVDLRDYFRWLVTLPIPKIMTGEINGARINYEISELLLNQDITAHGGYVRLTGLVTESIYIYGVKLHWIHAVFLGVLMALWCRVLETHREFLLLTMFSVILFSYLLCRGGISTLMPRLINGNLLLLVWLGWLYISSPSRRATASRRAFTPLSAVAASKLPHAISASVPQSVRDLRR